MMTCGCGLFLVTFYDGTILLHFGNFVLFLEMLAIKKNQVLVFFVARVEYVTPVIER